MLSAGLTELANIDSTGSKELRVETIGAVDKDFSSTLESIAQISLSVED
jgi:hypothetical protein